MRASRSAFGGLIDWRAAQAEADRLAKIAGVTIDWRLRVVDAPVHVRQTLEILRLLYRGADVLILDEPTAVLAPAQIEELLGLMRKLKAEGRTILFISHKLEEVMSVADAITVMRARPRRCDDDACKDQLSRTRASDGRRADRTGENRSPCATVGQTAIFARAGSSLGTRWASGGSARSISTFSPAKSSASPASPAMARTNSSPAPRGSAPTAEGRSHFAGVNMTRSLDSAFSRCGVGYLSADRGEEGLCLDASIRDNFIAGRERDPPSRAAACCGFAAIAVEARARARETLRSLRPLERSGAQSLRAATSSASRSRANSIAQPKLLVAAQPTRGVDIAGIAFIHSPIAALSRSRRRRPADLRRARRNPRAVRSHRRALWRADHWRAAAATEASVEKVGRLMLGQKAA